MYLSCFPPRNRQPKQQATSTNLTEARSAMKADKRDTGPDKEKTQTTEQQIEATAVPDRHDQTEDVVRVYRGVPKQRRAATGTCKQDK
jgi:hypothetical protein